MKLDKIRSLVCAAREDEESKSILMDWCLETGFEEAGEGLRKPTTSLECNRALTALRLLFGEEGPGLIQKGEYSAVLGFVRVAIAAGQVVTIEAQPQLLMKVRKIFIPENITRRLIVHDVRVGKYLLLASADPAPAGIFAPGAPDLLDHTLQVNERLRLTVENTSNVEVDFTGCALGLDVATMERKRNLALDSNAIYGKFSQAEPAPPAPWQDVVGADQLFGTPNRGSWACPGCTVPYAMTPLLIQELSQSRTFCNNCIMKATISVKVGP